MMARNREDKPKANEIWYYAPEKVTLYTETDVVNHTFSNGKGVVTTQGTILRNWFYDIDTITELKIAEDTYTSIGGSALYRMAGIQELILPDSIISIGSFVIRSDSSLLKVKFPAKLETLGTYNLYQCPNIIEVSDIPATMTDISNHTFVTGKYPYLIFRGLIPPTLGGAAIFTWNNTAPLYVPAEAVDAYKEATYWSYFKARIQAIPDNLL